MCGISSVGGCGGSAAIASGGGVVQQDSPGGVIPELPKDSHAAMGAMMIGQSIATAQHAAGHDKIIVQTAQNPAQANAVFQAAMSKLANLRADQLGPSPTAGGDHLKVPDEIKAQWKAEFPQLPVPNYVIVDRKSGRAVGALFAGGKQAANLGMGTAHQHTAGGSTMQHIWFTPGNMDLAFSDVGRKKEAIQAAAARP